MTGRRTYGEGGVHQRASDGRWIGTLEAGWTTKGTRRRVYVTGKTEAEVKRRLRDRRAEIAKAAGQVTSGAMTRATVKTWATEWLGIRRQSVRPKTYDVDKAAVAWLLPAAGGKRLMDLTPRDLRAFHSRQREAGLATSTIARNHRAVAKLLRDALQEGYPVPVNVLTVKAPAVGENDREALETVQAVAVMHHATALPHGSRYFVAFYQGLRQAEVLGLTWDAIDFARGTITVEWQLQPLPYLDRRDRSKGFRIPDGYTARHLTGRFHLVRPKTSKGFRVVPMVPAIAEALARQRAVAGPTVGNLVWVRPNGWPIDKADDAAEFRDLQAAACVRHPSGRPYFGHEIRNTTATLLLEAGADPVTITAILGHSSWATSAGYMTARVGPMRAAMEQIAAALTPAAELG